MSNKTFLVKKVLISTNNSTYLDSENKSQIIEEKFKC